jgi:integrase
MRDARVKKYRFHDYRNTALTNWARQGVNVDIAMKASGHTSVQMHKRGTWICKGKTLRRLSDCYRMVTRTRTRERSSRK